MALKREELHRLARRGAELRLAEIKQEAAAIRDEFPELLRKGWRAGAGVAAVSPVRKGRRPMSAAERKSVSQRMRKYWGQRRKAKAGQ